MIAEPLNSIYVVVGAVEEWTVFAFPGEQDRQAAGIELRVVFYVHCSKGPIQTAGEMRMRDRRREQLELERRDEGYL